MDRYEYTKEDDIYDYECDKADFDPNDFEEEEEEDVFQRNGFASEADFWRWKGF